MEIARNFHVVLSVEMDKIKGELRDTTYFLYVKPKIIEEAAELLRVLQSYSCKFL